MLGNEKIIVTQQKTSAIVQLFAREGVLRGLAMFYLSTVCIPAMVVALLLLADVHSWWIPADICTITLLALLWMLVFRGISREESLLLGTIVLGSIALVDCPGE